MIRDGNCCRQCQRGEKLQIHHISGHLHDSEKFRNHPLNLITLCRDCHEWWDKWKHILEDIRGEKINIITLWSIINTTFMVANNVNRYRYLGFSHQCRCKEALDLKDRYNQAYCADCHRDCHCNGFSVRFETIQVLDQESVKMLQSATSQLDSKIRRYYPEPTLKKVLID
jgi:hypothetical protein